MPRVLVVDDETYITDLLALALRHVGFDVDTAGSCGEAITTVRKGLPDLVVLDVMLPDGNGIDFCRRLRADGLRVPVLFLTARDANEDKVRGLTVGGDDYVTKPFSIQELIARIHAILRRANGDEPESRHLAFADLVLDEDTYLVSRAGQPVSLSPTELKLLRYLLANAGRVVSKAQILDHVWQYDFGGDASVVEQYISYLRKKVDRLGPPLIQTVRGVGYSLRRA
ncbi:MAG: two-component system, OmpR family, response regulator [Acidimicrobiia bacterium]|jgi:two-component system OmpR family response regulator|nr:two-component system, OmpR family, response regulator [Acidimicrobiia bacterium]